MTHVMSEGITAYDFVQQVYYLQEKTILDFWPTDDKFQEVLMEANIVLKELEAQQDWTWLRETIALGDTSGGYGEIVQFVLPSTVYKLSSLNHDSIRLCCGTLNDSGTYDISERHILHVPIASAGDQRWNREQQVNQIGVNHVHDFRLRAVVHGHTIKLNRLLLPWENNLVAVVDVQEHIEPFHICKYDHTLSEDNHFCTTEGSEAKMYLTQIPDPTYVVYATAARHAEGSPPALARVSGLQDNAQRLLSQMRQNDADATDSDYIEWDVPGYLEVI